MFEIDDIVVKKAPESDGYRSHLKVVAVGETTVDLINKNIMGKSKPFTLPQTDVILLSEFRAQQNASK